MHNFHDKLIKVYDRVQQATKAVNRSVDSVKILAVSKTRNATTVAEAFAAGQHCFGENYLQEALDKQRQIDELIPGNKIEWHFIGPIQSNKTRFIANHFSWVHSVDRLKIAQRLSEQRSFDLPPLKICIQVNIDNEDSKSGVSANELLELAKNLLTLPQLELTGLMAIPLPRTDYQDQYRAFKKVSALKEELQHKLNIDLPTLSMGMSADLEAAVSAGSTLVRVGTDLFGPRTY